MFLFGVKADLNTIHKCVALWTEQWIPETVDVPARINHGPCQILRDEMPKSSLSHKEKLKWKNSDTSDGRKFRKCPLENWSLLCNYNTKISTHLLLRKITMTFVQSCRVYKVLPGVLAYRFYSSLECVGQLGWGLKTWCVSLLKSVCFLSQVEPWKLWSLREMVASWNLRKEKIMAGNPHYGEFSTSSITF